jgi:2-haloacid dehalogenase
MPATSPLEVVVFDVNETLSDMSPMAHRFVEVGAEPGLAQTWFASLLRDGFALTAAGATERFAALARECLVALLAEVYLDRDVDDAVEHILAGFSSLHVHSDVPGGVVALADSGLRLVTLTNGASAVADGLLKRAGVRGSFEALLSVEDAGVWKPAAGAYDYAARQCDTDLAAMLLVAVHPWDIDGAARAGMQTAWVNRSRRRYPATFTPPDLTVGGIDDLAAQLP